MEFIIDTVNLEDIKEAVEYMPIVGVTSNPSIVKKTSPKDFFKHMKEVRKIIGKERSLHIQVISKECDEIVKEAHRIIEEIDDQVYTVKFKGDLVDSNFSMLGHVTLYFTEVPDVPQNNAIYLSPEKMPSIHVGSTIEY